MYTLCSFREFCTNTACGEDILTAADDFGNCETTEPMCLTFFVI